MRAKLSIELEVIIRLSSDKRKLARYVNRVIEEQKNFWDDEGY